MHRVWLSWLRVTGDLIRRGRKVASLECILMQSLESAAHTTGDVGHVALGLSMTMDQEDS